VSRALFALDLANDPDLIAAYEARHAPGSVWPEVVRDIRQRGYREMEIWRVGNRLVMLAEISPDGLSASDPEVRPVVDRWEAEMDVYQRPIVADGPKWQPMTRIFSLEEQPES
jgi:L-rhamnose mutarotase